MRFRQHQDQARAATRRLLLLFLLTVVLTVAVLNGVLALLWKLQVVGAFGYPRWFFETNSVVATAFILGGSWIESMQLRRGGAHVAQMVGGREVLVPADTLERRLRNIVEEMAIASGLKPPRVFVLPRDDSINAFAAGWEQHDSVVAVTRGALERLTRDELQGVVAHEFSHILHGDVRLNMRLIGYVWGLQLLFMLGRDLFDMTDARGRRSMFLLLGLALMGVGSIGWLAGRLLKAAVSRQREFLADAAAVQFTRLPAGIGGALRKIAGQKSARVHSSRAEAISHMLLSSDIFIHGRALATHPPLAERIRRVLGRPMPPLPSPVLAAPDAASNDTGYGAPLPWDETPSPVLPFAPDTQEALQRPAPAGIADAPGVASPAQRAGQGMSMDWLDAMLQLPFPPDLEATTLAFLLAPGDMAQTKVWCDLFRRPAAAAGDRLVRQVQALAPACHLPAFERLLTRCAALPLAARRRLRGQAHDVVRADGRLSLVELWRCMLLDHVLDLAHGSVLRETHALSLPACAAAIGTVTDVLAWQHGDVAVDAGAMARKWRLATAQELALQLELNASAHAGAAATPPSLASLRAALRQLARLSPMRRPHLLKTWCTLLGGEIRPVAQPVWDSLRCICLLIDTPLPPEVQARFFAPGAELR